jgi:hypothetical protein
MALSNAEGSEQLAPRALASNPHAFRGPDRMLGYNQSAPTFLQCIFLFNPRKDRIPNAHTVDSVISK